MAAAATGVQSVARALEIVEFVSSKPRTQSEIAEHLGVHRSTALRLLDTLNDAGFTRRDQHGLHRIGYRLAGLAQQAGEQFSLPALARPYLESLQARTGHTVHLAELAGRRIVYADKIEPDRSVRLYSLIGQPVPLHTSGVAKAILAYQPPQFVDEALNGYVFTRHTRSTLSDADALRAELRQVAEAGWSVDDAEFEDFINCIAAPIRNAASEVIAAVSVTALKAQADLAALKTLVPALLATTESLSKELGWRP
jgi:DNA-binding IclR family transcriptional regulator